MRKMFFILCLLAVSFFIVGISSIKADELGYYEKYSSNEDVYVPPIEFVGEKLNENEVFANFAGGNETILKGWTQGTSDQYEWNDDFSTATLITKTSTTYATLHTNAWWYGNCNDQDYFKFVTTKKINLILKLESIPSECDYDVKIYDWNKQFIPGSGGYKSGNSDELVNINLGVGTYYIHIFSLYDHNNDSDSYVLNLDSSELIGTSFHLSNQNKSQYKAAFWESHYFPNNIDPDNYDGKAIYEILAGHSGVTHKGNFDSFLTISNNSSTTKYLSRLLFVWGAEEKRQIANDLEKIYNQLGYYSNSSEINIKLILSTGSLITALISLIPGGQLFSYISIGLGAASILPFENSKRVEEHRAWLNSLIVTLRTSADAPGEQVVRIKSWYSCQFVSTSSAGSYGGGGYIYIKFHWTDTSLESLSYNINHIYSHQEDNLFCGDVKPLKDISDFGRIFK